jgi:hypothetical protein
MFPQTAPLTCCHIPTTISRLDGVAPRSVEQPCFSDGATPSGLSYAFWEAPLRVTSASGRPEISDEDYSYRSSSLNPVRRLLGRPNVYVKTYRYGPAQEFVA